MYICISAFVDINTYMCMYAYVCIQTHVRANPTVLLVTVFYPWHRTFKNVFQ